MQITDLRDLAKSKGVELPSQKEIVQEAKHLIEEKFGLRSPQEIKASFDNLIAEHELICYKTYLQHEKEYGGRVISCFMRELEENGVDISSGNIGSIFEEHFKLFDKFFLSLAQGRKARAGKSFEEFHNLLFKQLHYPFDEQIVINGKPDFLMPYKEHYFANAMDCIIFTAKRTLRERWRQIVTEGTRGLGFFLATIDEDVSENQINEMREHRIYLVVPETIKEKIPHYKTAVNVLSFRKFFQDHLDPRVEKWKRDGMI